MTLTKSLQNITTRYLPPPAARLAKRLGAPARYRSQLSACREGFREHGHRYPQRTLFIAGLPKSGTTWLERMVARFPGFSEVMIPEVARHEMTHGGSHDFELPDDMFSRFQNALVLTKMHMHGSEHNCRVLRDAGVKYVVLYRDLRDVAVSNYFYVRRVPWHPDHETYANTTVTEGLKIFAQRLLGPYAEWVRSWDRNRDPDASLVLRYEDLLADSGGCLRRVAAHFELGDSQEQIDGIVESLSRRSLGTTDGDEPKKQSTLVRKGVAGDWVNHFDDELRREYKERIGEFLIDYGYEKDMNW